MKFTDFLNEGELVKFQKTETSDLKKLYDLLEDEHGPKTNSMGRLATYQSEKAGKYFVSYEGFVDYKDEDGDYTDEDYGVVYEAKLKDGKWSGISKFASDDTVSFIIKDLKKLHPDLKKID